MLLEFFLKSLNARLAVASRSALLPLAEVVSGPQFSDENAPRLLTF